MKVILTEAAWDDLFHIGKTIAAHNRNRANSFVDQLYNSCRELGLMPRAYPLLPDHEASGIRRRVHGNYLIFYRIGADAIEIIHALHGAVDYARLLFPDGDDEA